MGSANVSKDGQGRLAALLYFHAPKTVMAMESATPPQEFVSAIRDGLELVVKRQCVPTSAATMERAMQTEHAPAMESGPEQIAALQM
jgi:hypothetical protein